LIGIVVLPVMLVCGILSVFVFLPPEIDDPIPLAQQGGGARQDDNGVTGLQASWAPLAEP